MLGLLLKRNILPVGDDLGTGIQNQNLIGDDVAEEINAAIGEQISGSVTPPTVVKPTHSSPPITAGPEPANEPPAPADPPPAEEPPAVDEPVSQPEPPSHDEPAAEPPAPEPAAEPPAPEPTVEPPAAAPAFDLPDEEKGSGNSSELFDIKQQALKELSPLVEHLEQSPEERFETILMMLRASDDPALVQPAFTAAQAIQDDKKKAQALLDVVNEVNYLTRPQSDQ